MMIPITDSTAMLTRITNPSMMESNGCCRLTERGTDCSVINTACFRETSRSTPAARAAGTSRTIPITAPRAKFAWPETWL